MNDTVSIDVLAERLGNMSAQLATLVQKLDRYHHENGERFAAGRERFEVQGNRLTALEERLASNEASDRDREGRVRKLELESTRHGVIATAAAIVAAAIATAVVQLWLL